MKNGYVQVYTGNGKGKTTAALGLTLRALGAGLRVYFAQFMKCGETSEMKALRTFGSAVTIAQFGNGKELLCPDAAADQAAAQAGWQAARAALTSGAYDVVVLDEINVAAYLGHVSEAQVQQLIAEKPRHTELLLTGRYALQSVMEAADLVTEMREVKHYYGAGVHARKGIEK